MKNLFSYSPILLFSCLLVLSVTACTETKGSYPPVWKGFTYEPTSVTAGDSVVITAVQATKGKYLNKTTYSWSMTIKVVSDGETKDSTLSYSATTNYGGTDNSDPQWALLIPENAVSGTYACSFKATWSNSADGEGGTYACQNDGTCSGSITSYSYTLYSNANGSFSLPIK